MQVLQIIVRSTIISFDHSLVIGG